MCFYVTTSQSTIKCTFKKITQYFTVGDDLFLFIFATKFFYFSIYNVKGSARPWICITVLLLFFLKKKKEKKETAVFKRFMVNQNGRIVHPVLLVPFEIEKKKKV